MSLPSFSASLSSLPAPSQPPWGVKVTLIEDDTALVSWKQPEEPNLAVTHYTILYASRKAWIAGEWQVLQREGKRESKTIRTPPLPAPTPIPEPLGPAPSPLHSKTPMEINISFLTIVMGPAVLSLGLNLSVLIPV